MELQDLLLLGFTTIVKINFWKTTLFCNKTTSILLFIYKLYPYVRQI